jgi:hypothetical protein
MCLLDLRPMSFERRYIKYFFSLCLSAGLLVAQICNVVCIAGGCTDEKKVVAPTTSHCHEASSSSPSEPSPETHSCPNHDLTVLLSASSSILDTIGHLDWHPVAFIPARLEIVFTQQRPERVRFSALRSPPRIPQRLILRI